MGVRIVGTLTPGILLIGVFGLRAITSLAPADPQVGADLPAAARLSLAADEVAVALGVGGSGFTFTVIERSTLQAKPGGPKVEIPDPIDRYKSLGFADQYYVGAVIADGSATPDGLWLEMRRGPATEKAAPDFVNAPVTLAALTAKGVTYRNDGDGWYVTANPPGIGFDTVTLGLLPSLLREAQNASLTKTTIVNGTTQTTFDATGAARNAPGLMAVDASSFTALVGGMQFTVDTNGRLIGIHAVTQNLRLSVYDLLVDVTIEIRYDTSPGLPKPDPTLAPAVKP